MHSKATQAAISARRAKLIAYRREGIRYDDPRITGPESPTCLGYSSVQGASKDLIRALEEARDAEKAEASVYRQQENERLDSLLEAVWDKATTPSPVFNKEREIVGEEIDLKAVDTVLKLMDRRAKLNGLDMPQRTELSGPDGGAVPLGSGSLDELNTLIGYAGQPNTPTADNSDQEDAGGDTDG
ncbi:MULTISPECIES: hypothetical protein [unclassified Streptomyces]|uniref:hypothetical protein n=1 Tax=unclassified Streptomyces TaxID=2593676 RepID=UPI0008052BFE|nr:MULTISPECIES: hypothetical protein [unclassified Streptomyces]MYR75187.1 hypothetical protein [Streptomyces sp. SID4925]SBU98127.1 hypothetical protein YUMDRAFT_06063 [Streptomyces sp. OspMP-M45]